MADEVMQIDADAVRQCFEDGDRGRAQLHFMGDAIRRDRAQPSSLGRWSRVSL